MPPTGGQRIESRPAKGPGEASSGNSELTLVARKDTLGNPVCYRGLALHNAEATAAFLGRVLEWDIEHDASYGIHEAPAGEGAKASAGRGVFTLRKARLPFSSHLHTGRGHRSRTGSLRSRAV